MQRSLRLLFSFMITISIVLTFPAQASSNQNCDGEKAISKVYGAFAKYVCLGQFFGVKSQAEQNQLLAKCSQFLSFGPLGGIAAAGAHKFYMEGKVERSARQINDLSLKKQMLDGDEKMYQAKLNGPRVLSDSEYAGLLRRELNAISVSKAENLQAIKGAKAALASLIRQDRKVFGRLLVGGLGVGALGIFAGLSPVLDASPAGCGERIHAYVDTNEKCGLETKIGVNSARFLSLPAAEQKSLMKEIPQLCQHYDKVADNLEAEINKAFPQPQFIVKSCNSNNQLQEVEVHFPTTTFNIAQNGANNLRVNTGASERSNYELDLNSSGGYGVDSINTVRVNIKDSKVKRAHVPSQILTNPQSTDTQERELATSLKAYYGYTLAKNTVGNQCRDFMSKPAENPTQDSNQRPVMQ
jgi:hypothetical protein